MHKYLILVTENDTNGNKKTGLEPQYFYLDDSMKVRETYKRYRNIKHTEEVTDEETGETSIVQTGIRKYTVELCEGKYIMKSKDDADAFVDGLIIQ